MNSNPVFDLAPFIKLAVWAPVIGFMCLVLCFGISRWFKRITEEVDQKQKDW